MMRDMVKVYQRPDGGISLVVPAWDDMVAGFDSDAETEEAFFGRQTAKAIPADAVDLGSVDKVSLPRANGFRMDALTQRNSRLFRDCWRWDGAGVLVDMPMARAEKMKDVRRIRNGKLAALDGERARAQDANGAAELQRIATEAQTLRDMPATAQAEMDAIDDPEALADYAPIWPREETP